MTEHFSMESHKEMEARQKVKDILNECNRLNVPLEAEVETQTDFFIEESSPNDYDMQ